MPLAQRESIFTDIAEYRSFKDVTKALQLQFAAARIPLSLPADTRRMLQNFVDEHDGDLSVEDSRHASLELKEFWEEYIGDSPAKAGAFVGVLRELRPLFTREADILEWWQSVVKPVLANTGYRKAALEDAVEFLVGAMVYDGEDSKERARAKLSGRLLDDLLKIYVARTRELSEDDRFTAASDGVVAQQTESTLVAYGKKQPKNLLNAVDDLVLSASTRLQGLTLLSSFLRNQTPHVYLVINTPLVEHLLQCLMNDTSTTVLSVALTSLIMLLPHIPGSLPTHLPRLFLVYSRLLCWEKFSPLSSEAQKNLVTDDRVSIGPEADHGDVGIDPAWEKVRPKEGMVESATPELMTYFTYLYGLYPLNFTRYIHKPRRFLKDCEFPGAEDFDLEQAVIRSRTEQFRQVHLMHPNFYNMTVEEELIDPKWPKADPADVVAECHALCINTKPTLLSPGPPPTTKLPQLPQLSSIANMKSSPQVSPSTSHASFRTGNSWRDTHSTAAASTQTGDADSPVLRPHSVQSDDESAIPALRPRSKGTNRTSPSLDDFPQPGVSRGVKEDAPQTNVAYLQRENTLLRNELNFEKWHKSQYSAHIGQLMRKNVKDATSDAQSLNQINANRVLNMQLDQVRNARDLTVKDSALTRKNANSVEANLTGKLKDLKKEQESWNAQANELQRLRAELVKYREVLVRTEQRELDKSMALEILKRKDENRRDTDKDLHKAQLKLREYESREFEMEKAKREVEVLVHEKESLQLRARREQHEYERERRGCMEKINELEKQLEAADNGRRRGLPAPTADTQAMMHQAITDSQSKLNQLRKKHTALMERYTDLEMEYESVKAQLDAMQGDRGRLGNAYDEEYSLSSRDQSMSGALSTRDGYYDTTSDLTAFSENAYITSASDPSARRFQPKIGGLPVSPPASEVTMHSSAGLTWKPPMNRQNSIASRGSYAPATTFNQTAPLQLEETKTISGKSSHSTDSVKKDKITPDSQVRVYGRGELAVPRLSGAQNIKMKPKNKDSADKIEKPEKERKGFRSLKNLHADSTEATRVPSSTHSTLGASVTSAASVKSKPADDGAKFFAAMGM
ncbi:hypothetical protein LTR22_020929 [Elasticomyces elasticus]|nr:hypothetical protein LTR22_020929 [Elasticomyces elasticus]KAK4909604.1 hypothetical protein LTR49_021648 [Elasticomyces elasticus]KAK5749509.1 hypothetical protein LTS12_020445 [Elasticomyces elasticus]